MALIIELPQVGESVVEGTIGKWLKQPGDQIEKYDPLVEVVTDKVTMELPSPVSGKLLRILAQEGETIPMGAPIAEVETPDVKETPGVIGTPDVMKAIAPATPPAALAATPPARASTTGYLVKDLKQVGPTGAGVEAGPPPPVAATPAASVTAAPARPDAPPAAEPARLSPAVRRLAREHGIDLSRLAGTGMGGRITRDDVLRHLDSGPVRTAAPPASMVTPPPASRTKEIAKEIAVEIADVTAGEEHIPLTPVRRMIAEAMVRSVTQIPHAWSTIEVDVTSLVSLRNGLRNGFQAREGVDLTYLPFIIKMVVEALRENPTLNATWGGDKIILKRRINLGIAVAGPQGLIVPVIHDADRLSIAGLAHALADLTSRVRQKKLTLGDVQGGSFTLNNTGVLGSTLSQPIINYPQAAILTTEAIQKRPVVINDAIAIRSMMNLCLSFDHRINDGAESSAFLQSVKRRIEAIDADTSVY
ncbi:MAG TPA: dihydrolipoamide acetyltransferase family protein [Dehalococcoidia bacterium]|nr:dihydrolipoamide acetyltransferase family protein [Dehalococcoidia bacterium]